MVTFFIDIVGDIFKKVATNGLKVFLGVITTLFTAGLIGGIYYLITAFIL